MTEGNHNTPDLGWLIYQRWVNSGLELRYQVWASDGDFIRGYGTPGQAHRACLNHNALACILDARIFFFVHDTEKDNPSAVPDTMLIRAIYRKGG